MKKYLVPTFTLVMFWFLPATLYAPNDGPLLPPQVEILADTNRNGIVDINDASAKHTWTSQSGSIYTVNFDADGGLYHPNASSPANKRSDAITFGDDGKVDFEDYFINTPAASGGPADVDDIATIKIKAMPGLDPHFRVYLKVSNEVEMRAIHIFRKRVAGTSPLTDAAIWGGGHNQTDFPTPWTDGDSEVKDIEVTRWLNPNTNTTTYEETRSPANSAYYQFGIEGLLLAGMKYYPPVGAAQTFSGYIYLTVEVRDGSGTPISGMSDTICMRVAPWIGLSAGEPSEQIWAAEKVGNWTEWTAASAPFRSAPANGSYTGFANSPDNAQFRLVTNGAETTSAFLKDHLEWGYTQRPGGPRIPLAFRMPYPNAQGLAQPKWPVVHFLQPNVGVFQIGQLAGSGYHGDSGNYGGNLAFFPRSTAIPNGRFMMGSNTGSRLQTFLSSQEIQYSAGHSFLLNFDWLSVGHIDEAFTFLSGNRVVEADSAGAIQELETIPVAQRAGKVFFSLDTSPKTDTLSANTTAAVPNVLHIAGITPQSGYNFIRILNGPCAGYVAKIQCGTNSVTIVTENCVSAGGGTYTALWSSFGGVTTNTMAEYRKKLLEGPSSFPTNPTNKYPLQGNAVVLVAHSLRSEHAPTNPGAPQCQGMPAVITVDEILADTTFKDFNKVTVPLRKAANRVVLDQGAAGQGVTLQYINVPVLFFGIAGTDGMPKEAGALYAGTNITYPGAVSFQPNPCNLQPVGNRLYFPRQWAPRAAGALDMFETLIAASTGFTETKHFVDDWSGYHVYYGNVHCGTNVRRSVPSNNWWQ